MESMAGSGCCNCAVCGISGSCYSGHLSLLHRALPVQDHFAGAEGGQEEQGGT